ncbi:helix-turn-helix transcriptional regulator [Cellulosimicrobium sp. NPDC057127]|uniref:helix-turn-helix transcriptional regulator n=1 Tax=Cellulosimicrobium sp. NPDC057127 TaxID=3346026 RepID=UPI00363ED23C
MAAHRTNARSARDIGAHVRRVRRARGVTQAELADEMGITRQYLSELENGVDNLYITRLFEVLDHLDITLRLEERP